MSNKKNVLITGCSSGIGRLTAITVARAGHHVLASMRSLKGKNQVSAHEISSLARSEGLNLEVLELDVADLTAIEGVVRDLTARDQKIDVLVNNAGKMSIGVAEGFTDEQLQDQFVLNFYGPVRLCRAVLPQMRERRSDLIIHVSSIPGRVLFPFGSIYCASKFAVEAYAEVLHYELNGLGVDSVLVEPGPYPTNLIANSSQPFDLARVQEYGQLPLSSDLFVGRFKEFLASESAPNPQEVADAILRLINLPSGRRPLRTVCGTDYGTSEVNDRNAPVQAQLLNGLGLGALAHRVA